MADVADLPVDRVAHGLVVGDLLGVGFIEVGLGLAADHRPTAGASGDGAVAGAVGEPAGASMMKRSSLACCSPLTAVMRSAIGFDVGDVGVQQQGQRRFGLDRLPQGEVERGRTAGGVEATGGELDLFEDAGLARIPAAVGARCADDADADLREALPPSTGRFWTRTTSQPRRAAAIAAHTPLRPPPTTTRSAASGAVGCRR